MTAAAVLAAVACLSLAFAVKPERREAVRIADGRMCTTFERYRAEVSVKGEVAVTDGGWRFLPHEGGIEFRFDRARTVHRNTSDRKDTK